jgi:hypothetical protein
LKKSHKILDHMGSTELAAKYKLFARGLEAEARRGALKKARKAEQDAS